MLVGRSWNRIRIRLQEADHRLPAGMDDAELHAGGSRGPEGGRGLVWHPRAPATQILVPRGKPTIGTPIIASWSMTLAPLLSICQLTERRIHEHLLSAE
jgi:hypothetical protein